MKSNIISNVLSLKEKPDYLRFSVTFVSKMGAKEEYIFFETSVSQCVIKTIAFVNFMFRCRGMMVVYIFPTNSSSFYRNIYRRADGADGHYKIVKCHPEIQLDILSTIDKWNEA